MLRQDLEDAQRLQVSMAPTFLLNGRAFEGLPWDFDRIVEDEFNRLPDETFP